MVYAVVTGGGTSGHVIPARAVLEGLIEAGHHVDSLRYVGSRRGIERTLMADSGVACEFLPMSGLQRSLTLRGIVRNLVLPFRLMRSKVMARSLLKTWQPRVVISVGGYASEPISAAAISLGVPLVCVSYDRTPGLATRRQARHARVSAVAFTGSQLPRAQVTGAPVRAEIRHLNIAERRFSAREELGISQDATMVTIVGGSLGSGILNNLAGSLLFSLNESTVQNIVLFHVAGSRNDDSSVPHASGVDYRRVGYESRMADLYASTDVLLCRAGASTIAEIATVGMAAVIVPWSGAADDHQTKNAEWLAEADAAMIFRESQCSDGSVVSAVVHLVENPVRRAELVAKSRAMGEMHRSGALISLIENAAL